MVGRVKIAGDDAVVAGLGAGFLVFRDGRVTRGGRFLDLYFIGGRVIPHGATVAFNLFSTREE